MDQTAVTIKKASRQDLPAIRALMHRYGDKMRVESYHLSKRDIALQARAEDGTLIGFVWGGLMAGDRVCYVDKVAVAPEYARRGVTQALYRELFRQALRRGVKEAFGVIRQDQYHDKSCVNALKMAWGADQDSYTYVRANLEFMRQELLSLTGVDYGRQ